MFSSLPLKWVDFHLFICFLTPLSQGRWRHEILDDWFLQSSTSFVRQFCPKLRRVYQSRFRTISFLTQVPRMTNDREGICEHNSQLSVSDLHTFLCFPFSSRARSLAPEWDMTRWWQILFWDTTACNPELCALEPRVFAWWNVIILFSVCAVTLYASVHAVWVGALVTPPVGWREVSPDNRNWSWNWQKIKKCQTVKNARNSNFSSSNCHGPNLLTRTKATGLPATFCRTSSLFEGRLHSHILQFPQTLVLFAIWLVDCEEWFSNLVESLLFILFSLEQKPGRGFHGGWAPSWFNLRIQCFEFWILSALVALYEWFTKTILSCSIVCSSVHPMSDTEFLFL